MRITLFSLIILIIFFGCTPVEPTLVEPESTPTLYFNGPIITMCGDEVTIADLCVYGDVGQISPAYGLCQATGFNSCTPKNVFEWMNTMENEPGYHESHKIFIETMEKITSKL